VEPAATPAPRRVRDHRLRTGTTPSAASSPAMTPVMPPPRSCGGDMSSPQKCPSTRHDSQTASDNRLIETATSIVIPAVRAAPNWSFCALRAGRCGGRLDPIMSGAARFRMVLNDS
jgi:hypothetical protein